MKQLLYIGFFSLLISQSAVHCDEDEAASTDEPKEEDGVLVLTNDNFVSVINKAETILVEFYAPWCGHCKSLAPEYAAAAKELKKEDPPILLAKVDATVENELAKKYDVSGYPTLKFFKSGVENEYDGPRTRDGIVKYMRERSDKGWMPPPEAVLTLTKENFTDIVDSADLILVEFYAPWCGHCKQLAAPYEKAAQKLRSADPPIPLAKVDATVETELGQTHDINGYPTLKVFRKGKSYEYNGPREEHGIVDYMENQRGEGTKLAKTLKDLKKAMLPTDVTVVGFFEDEGDTGFEAFVASSNEKREEFTFRHTFDAAARDFYKANSGQVLVFYPERFHTKYESKRVAMDIKEETTSEEISKFCEDNEIPLVGHFSYELKEKRYKEKDPIVLLFYTVDFSHDHIKATQMWRNKLADVAKEQEFRSALTFAVADEEENADLFKAFNFDDSGEELNIGILGKGGKKYPMPAFEEWDSDDVKEFLRDFIAGKVKPIVKSQPTPKSQKQLKVVVGNNWDDIVGDDSKDVLVEFYAPWCGHCKSFEPKYKKMADKYKSESKLVLAKMDATANDAPVAYAVSGFPTIYLAPAGAKDQPVKYDGDRSPEDIDKFLRKNCKAAFQSKQEL